MFWLDSALASSIYLDGIIVVVDAVNILKNLDDTFVDQHHGNDQDTNSTLQKDSTHAELRATSTANIQLSYADVVILNKSDLIDDVTKSAIEQRIHSINALAKIIPTTYAELDKIEDILDLETVDNDVKRWQDTIVSDPQSFHDHVRFFLIIGFFFGMF